jgi:hypothetical protein
MFEHHTKSKGDLGILKAKYNNMLRVGISRNNQCKNVNFAEDFRKVP